MDITKKVTSDTLSKTSFNIKMSHFIGMKKVNTFEYTSLLFEKGMGKINKSINKINQ
jgi:hypothetical protein